jgi:hypothetical protein
MGLNKLVVKHVDTDTWWHWFNSEDWNDHDTSDLLHAVSNRLYTEQRALAYINIQSDSYPVLVIHRTQAAAITELAAWAGYGAIDVL